jgi:PII-like signaling protein
VKGYQITFIQQNRHHRGKPLADWLVHLAGELDLHGATLIPASEGMGYAHHLHSAHFFELADQPLLVIMAITSEEADRLFERLRAEGIQLFYVKAAVEFGTLGDHSEHRKI